jgi:hypothetical protein
MVIWGGVVVVWSDVMGWWWCNGMGWWCGDGGGMR